jgi:hypothetical protein
MTKIVRTDVECLSDGNDLHIEVHEDESQGGFGHKVMLTLMGRASNVAIGRANIGQVLRRLTRPRAEDLVDAILNVLRRPDDVPIDASIRAKAESSMRPTIPVPVKKRPDNQVAMAGVELDHFGRKDLADKLRQIADLVEVRDPKFVIQQCDIDPIRGGGQSIAFRGMKIGQ